MCYRCSYYRCVIHVVIIAVDRSFVTFRQKSYFGAAGSGCVLGTRGGRRGLVYHKS